jgi:site-specific recombinase XerD
LQFRLQTMSAGVSRYPRRGHALSHSNVAHLTKPCEQLGIPRLTPHELRHTAMSLAIISGADIKLMQSLLGHKWATMTLDQASQQPLLFGGLFLP